MASVNATRRGTASKISDATDSAKLIGFNEEGLMCAWYGGCGFNVYDVTGSWNKVDHFTSMELAGMAQKFDEERRSYAKHRMESEGFQIVE